MRALDGLAGVDSAQRRPVQRPIGSCLGDCSQAALRSGDDGIEQATRQWQARRDLILDELADLPVISPDGGWSLLLDAAALGTSARTLSRCLLEHGQIAATPMTAWGPQVAPSYVRLVYSREPAARLAGLRARVQTAVAASSQPK